MINKTKSRDNFLTLLVKTKRLNRAGGDIVCHTSQCAVLDNFTT
jgi:hypothetical protein